MSNTAKKTKVFKLMIGVFVALLIVGYGWTRSGKPAATNDTADAQPATLNDQEQVKSLLIRLYKWKDAHLSGSDFEPVSDEKNSKYVGIDLDKHAARLDVLKRTAFFSDKFLANYDSIAKAIDRKLKSGELEWSVGDLPPFGNDANPWCSCQDYPSANPWDSIVISINSIDDKTALLSWTWGDPDWADSFSYNVRAIKSDDGWKISYLQGFDSNNFS